VTLVCVEKFACSFGFVGNLVYLMQQIAPGKYKMAHYAFATALMNLALVPTQMMSGWLADLLGYRNFFAFVLLASIPSVLAAWQAPFPDPPDVQRPRKDSRPRLLGASGRPVARDQAA
jgi:PAT family beta-lactamase induction signal transducer AmpG